MNDRVRIETGPISGLEQTLRILLGLGYLTALSAVSGIWQHALPNHATRVLFAWRYRRLPKEFSLFFFLDG